ncbi:bifunctional protein-serine/threonine kinase/phosphatase [Aestuariibacter sp. GS-14]|uniref:bifunctional protein-serine/threonine kinase/phosphatase n=1 Tax=Aestuariibacter sp. GS-14 TaxID=2590670 RepID=UPI00112D7D62|nr:bifunctional protein-serine/threonine kinase/phosphatase [Aestuariibacter sp. GS-14]TPV55425.1 bifunctional protein-serine/threonine kinase/phosphatase [Aestuariibacter sp. GS-14]
MLTVRWGACSSSGIKPINQDCQAMTVPDCAVLGRRGLVASIADGISSSQVSQYASELAVTHFNRDYLLTSENWSSARAARKVLETINTALYIKSAHSPYQGNPDRGYVCTFSGVILQHKSATVIHCGDSTILHCRGDNVTQLTQAHTGVSESGQQYLANALGIKPALDVDIQLIDIEPGDKFALMTDGVADYVNAATLFNGMPENHNQLTEYCEQVVENALAAGSSDNLTIQLLVVASTATGVNSQYDEHGILPRNPHLDIGATIDNWQLLTCLSRSDRSDVFIAQHETTLKRAVFKVPSTTQSNNAGFLDDMAKEEWIARRVNNPHVMKTVESDEYRSTFYTLTEYLDGQTLRQHLLDNGQATVKQVREWAAQLVTALTALHRKGILHQDIRPENILLTHTGRLVLIDFGSASIDGHQFLDDPNQLIIPGDLLYSAPEYFVGLWANEQADQYALACVLYYALSGGHPYGTSVARTTSYSALHKLRYQRLLQRDVSVPVWLDETMKRGCHPQAGKRYPSLSEFLYDLQHPNPGYQQVLPLAERNPVRFWQTVSGVLAVLLAFALIR